MTSKALAVGRGESNAMRGELSADQMKFDRDAKGRQVLIGGLDSVDPL